MEIIIIIIKPSKKLVNPIFEFRQKIILRKIKERTTMWTVKKT